MKALFTTLVFVIGVHAQAAPLEAVECKREMIAAALAAKAKTATLEALLSSDFSVSDFGYLEKDSGYGNYDYEVVFETRSRVDNTSVSSAYAIKVLDIKTCAVRVKFLTD